jgi:hypothetical protein
MANPDEADKAKVTKSGRTTKPSLKRKAAEVLKSIIPKGLKKFKTAEKNKKRTEVCGPR